MYRICSLRLSSNIRVRPAVIKKFYLRLTGGKMHTFEVLTEKYLQLYGCSSNSITTTVNCTNPNTEIHSEIIEVQIIKTQI